VLRSGTSIGANVEEAIGGQSEKDFGAKIGIAYKEARETHYWLRLLRDGGYVESRRTEELLADSEELVKILGSIQLTVRKKYS
jgi:four helix bundle protein